MCPGGCGADEAKGWCGCWDDHWAMTTDFEAQGDGHVVPGRHVAHRDLKPGKMRRRRC